MLAQPLLFDAPPARPEGMVYRPEFVSRPEEAALLAWLATLPFEPFHFRGVDARRRVVSFGWRYDSGRARLERADDIPAELAGLQARAANLAGLAPADLAQVLINDYPPGAPIGWHRDRPIFDKVVGVSLGASCSMRFRRAAGEGFERLAISLEPRSAYVLTGPARHRWEHSIPPVTAHRFSVTFRSFRDGSGPVHRECCVPAHPTFSHTDVAKIA